MKNSLETGRKLLIDVIIIACILGGLALGMQLDHKLYSISIISIVLLIITFIIRKRKRIEVEKERIAKQWGRDHIEERNFSNVRSMFDFDCKENTQFFIDDITWNDLNMEFVFNKIDHTKSLPGMQYLYNILRKPLFDDKLLHKRNNIINSVGENKEISQSMQYPLSVLGKLDVTDIFNYFRYGIDKSTKLLPIYTVLSYMPYIALSFLLIDPGIVPILFVGILILNSTIYQVNKKSVYVEMERFKYIGNVIRCAENIIKIDKNKLSLDQKEIQDILKDIKQIRKNISKISFNEKFASDAEILVHYYNLLMLKEPKVFYKTVHLLNKDKQRIIRLYELVGKIDAYISIASYKDSLGYFCTPKLVEKSFHLESRGLYHPLLDDPVSYTFELDNKGALVTGSNASGKSTFLRTIGINCLFAQTLNIVLANNYTASYFKILTSIGTMDNIVKGDSYFMAEAKSLKRILDVLNPNQPVLCILDEIFRGTNTAERISAATVVLNYMINKSTCVIAATHDLELTNLVNEKFNRYHFKETIENKDITFDYKLREGESNTRNAIAILEYLNYPEEIYEEARLKAEEYLA